jgi:hypothetical protein
MRQQFDHYEQCPKCYSLGKDTRKDNLACYTDGGKHCFACQYHEFPRHYQKPKEVNHGTKSMLPGDFSKEVPNHAWKWLLQYGLPFTYWEEYCGYSEADERLVFKIGKPNMAFSIGRWTPKFGDDEPYEKRKWYLYGDNRNHCEVIGNPTENIVLVEDIVSAHKVGQVTQCIPLFGTNYNDAIIYFLMTQHKKVIMWLDNDQAGLVNSRAARLQSLTQCQVSVMTTDRDPKCYSIQDIEGML